MYFTAVDAYWQVRKMRGHLVGGFYLLLLAIALYYTYTEHPSANYLVLTGRCFIGGSVAGLLIYTIYSGFKDL